MEKENSFLYLSSPKSPSLKKMNLYMNYPSTLEAVDTSLIFPIHESHKSIVYLTVEMLLKS
jgi:hypothetical protein